MDKIRWEGVKFGKKIHTLMYSIRS